MPDPAPKTVREAVARADASFQRMEQDLLAITKAIEGIVEDHKEFKDFRKRVDDDMASFRVIKGWAVFAVLAILAGYGAAMWKASELNSSVSQHEKTLQKLEKTTEGAAQNSKQLSESNRQLANLVNTRFREVIGQTKLAALQGKTETVRCVLNAKSLRKTEKNYVEFEWPLLHPLTPERASKARLTATLPAGPSRPEFLPEVSTQASAELSENGRFAIITIYTPDPARLLRTPGAGITVELLIVVLD